MARMWATRRSFSAWFRVGEYDLTVTKSGYKDYVSRIEIQPELTRDLSGLSLDRDRAWWWWPAWIGGAAVTAVAVAVGVSGGDEGTPPEAEPLAAPPPPPVQLTACVACRRRGSTPVER